MKHFKMVLIAITSIVFSNPLFASDVSEATHLVNGNEKYSPISDREITVYVYKPSFPFKIIGTIEARGMADAESYALRGMLDLDFESALGFSSPGEKEDVALALKALKSEAASIGANGVIVAKQGQVRVNARGDTERRISGIAIRY